MTSVAINSLLAGSDLITVSPSTGFTLTFNGNDGDNFGTSAPMNLAECGTAFANGEYGGSHLIINLNNGLYGSGEDWLNLAAGSYGGISFHSSAKITSVAFGRDNGGEANQYTDRCVGTYTLYYTQVPAPGTSTTITSNEATGWKTIGTITIAEGGGSVTRYLRHQFEIGLSGGGDLMASGIRIDVPTGAAIDELELYPLPDSGTINFESSTYSVGDLSGQEYWYRSQGTTSHVAVTHNDGLYRYGQAVLGGGDPFTWKVYQLFSGPDYNTAQVDMRSSGGIWSSMLMINSGPGGSLYWGLDSTSSMFRIRNLITGSSQTEFTDGNATTAGHWYHLTFTFDFTNNTATMTAVDLKNGADVDTGITDVPMGIPGADAAARQAVIARMGQLMIRGPLSAGNGGATTWGAIDNINTNTPETQTEIYFEEPTYSTGLLEGQQGWERMQGIASHIVAVSDDGEYKGGQAITGHDAFTYVAFQLWTGNPAGDTTQADMRSPGSKGWTMGVSSEGEHGTLRFGLGHSTTLTSTFMIRNLIAGNDSGVEFTDGNATTPGHWYRLTTSIDYSNNTMTVTARDLTAGTDVATGLNNVNLGIPGADAAARADYMAASRMIMIRGPIGTGDGGATTWGAIDNIAGFPPPSGTVIVIQ